ncbi:lipooligosaccharide N-acetylglucosamine glycosyltransferase [[Haemophilus] ducreyi]|nr:glycosyl transferase, family 25 [[Haemophilus] ducreyi]VEG83969.1 lipooligosaccharide N-acetylglucosamine glycosyltransferase [[Haemophilus] ducreyi]
MMKKYLISLAKDQLRREQFFTQADTTDFQVFDAVNTMQQEWDSLAVKYDIAQFAQRYQRSVTKGEIGCALSHLGVYQWIVADPQIGDNDYCLVCEDDALFNQDVQSSLTQLLSQNVRADIVLVGQSKIFGFDDAMLEIEYPTTFVPQMVAIGNSIYRYAYPYKNYYAGTVAYLIKKSTARKLVSITDLPFWLADDFILFEQQFGLDIMVVRPLMAIENPALCSNLETARASTQQALSKKLLKYPFKKWLAIQRNIGLKNDQCGN